MVIGEINKNDLNSLLQLYTQLHDNPLPVINNEIREVWDNILSDKNHHIIVGCINDVVVSSCVLVIIQNLTHRQRPYALIENVITDKDYRNNGFATDILNYAKEIAKQQNCYKIMLLTGSKKETTLKFYERAGYNRNDKTAFIQWL